MENTRKPPMWQQATNSWRGRCFIQHRRWRLRSHQPSTQYGLWLLTPSYKHLRWHSKETSRRTDCARHNKKKAPLSPKHKRLAGLPIIGNWNKGECCSPGRITRCRPHHCSTNWMWWAAGRKSGFADRLTNQRGRPAGIAKTRGHTHHQETYKTEYANTKSVAESFPRVPHRTVGSHVGQQR